MTRGALLIALLAVATPVAHAQSGSYDRERDAFAHQRMEHRPGAWFRLGGVTSAHRPSTMFWVRDQPLRQLTVRAIDGAIYLRRVSIELDTHEIIDYPLNVPIYSGRSQTIQLTGQPVYRIQITTDPRWRGHYEVNALAGWNRRPGVG
jgi:hypothetical protein